MRCKYNTTKNRIFDYEYNTDVNIMRIVFHYWKDLYNEGIMTTHNKIVAGCKNYTQFRSKVIKDIKLREVVEFLYKKLIAFNIKEEF